VDIRKLAVLVDNLQLPTELVELIQSGTWADGLTTKDVASNAWPGEREIVLMPPPFHTIDNEVQAGNRFWQDEEYSYLTNIGEIDYKMAVIIADFGLGSDSPVILYYSDSRDPVVMYLRHESRRKWKGLRPEKVRKHTWVKTHSDFAEFAADLGVR